MATPETNGDGRAINPSGVYQHPDTKEELVFQGTSKFGNPGADAAVRLGFVYVGPLSEKSDLQPTADPTAAPLADTSPRRSVAELESELVAAREREELANNTKADSDSLADAPKKEAAKESK